MTTSADKLYKDDFCVQFDISDPKAERESEGGSYSKTWVTSAVVRASSESLWREKLLFPTT